MFPVRAAEHGFLVFVKVSLGYRDAPFGRNWFNIVATDNLGRVETLDAPEFFISGTSKVEIMNPKAGDKLGLVDGESPSGRRKRHPLAFITSESNKYRFEYHELT